MAGGGILQRWKCQDMSRSVSRLEKVEESRDERPQLHASQNHTFPFLFPCGVLGKITHATELVGENLKSHEAF